MEKALMVPKKNARAWGSFCRQAIFMNDTTAALTSCMKLFDFKQMDLLSAEDKISVQIEQKLEIASFI